VSLTVVILTYNEALHIGRAIDSVASVADQIVVVDSGSTDQTVELARNRGAWVLKNPFISQAQQFNWALTQLPSDTDWVFRLDADEIVSSELAESLKNNLNGLDSSVAGARVNRRIAFLGKQIRWGGVFPVSIVRVFRYNRGRSEDRWMDEHIIIDGSEVQLAGELLDDNKKPITWWIEKHNNYASREVIEILDAEYKFLLRGAPGELAGQSAIKRWLKSRIYTRLPTGFRAGLYFFYRFVLRLGILDGPEGRTFHVLQGFWYRYLVDVKLLEIRRLMKNDGLDVVSAIAIILDIDVTKR
jgi:glycosyltransferase involved in cell wall biosynthesis